MATTASDKPDNSGTSTPKEQQTTYTFPELGVAVEAANYDEALAKAKKQAKESE